jgi:hypothetical protein
VLLVAALLARPGTATDDTAVEATRASLEAAPPASSGAPVPSAPLPAARAVVRADGVDGLRLGMSAAEVVSAGFTVQVHAVGGCRRVSPGLDDTGPGPGLSGWLVGERLAAVSVDDRTGVTASYLGPGIGDALDDLPSDGLLRASTGVLVPWQPAPVVVDVAWLRPDPSVRVAFADLTGDGSIDHVQVREDVAEVCPVAERAAARRRRPPCRCWTCRVAATCGSACRSRTPRGWSTWRTARDRPACRQARRRAGSP